MLFVSFVLTGQFASIFTSSCYSSAFSSTSSPSCSLSGDVRHFFRCLGKDQRRRDKLRDLFGEIPAVARHQSRFRSVVRGHCVPVHYCGCDGLFSFHVEERLWGAYERLRLKNICLQLDILYQLGQAAPPLQFAGVRFSAAEHLEWSSWIFQGGPH